MFFVKLEFCEKVYLHPYQRKPKMKFLSQLQALICRKKVALTSSLFVFLVAFYNLSMDKLSKDQIAYSKADIYIRERMPEFAKRFFKYKKEILKPSSYYVYAIDIAYFFDYLKNTNRFNNMKLSDLSRITPEVIEEYIADTRTISFKNGKKVVSNRTERRKICILSSFFDYYDKMDFIPYNPLSKISRPHVPVGPGKGSNFIENLNLLDFVLNGSLSTKTGSCLEKLRNRDAAMIALMMSTGIKSSECVALDINDIDFEHNKIIVKARRFPNEVYFSKSMSGILSSYLNERISMIPVYGHENALFLSTQMKRLELRSLEYIMKKYSTLLFGDGHSITPRDLKNAFRFNSFEQTENLYNAAAINGMTPESLSRYYMPYLEQFEGKKGIFFNPTI